MWHVLTARATTCLLAVTLLALSTGAALAIDVAAGCDSPQPNPAGRQFFVDPARGAKENDGSALKPWRTLAEVLDPANHLVTTRGYSRTSEGLGPPTPVNPDGPIHPGDTIVLMSGDHGAVQVKQYVDSDFISVVAAKDQTPIVRSMTLIASSHWLFRGIKFQGARPDDDKSGPLVGLVSHAWLGPSDNIVFVGNSFSTADNAANWSPEDWVNRPYAVGFRSSARCATLRDNHFFNLRDAVAFGCNQGLIEGNLIEDMGNDGIDIAGSDLVVRANRIRSSRHMPAEQLHPDGIQGWTLHGATNRNVVVDRNFIANLNPSEDNYLQGISIFDGKWDGLAVTNNLVLSNAWHGISLWGVDNASVVNNTVIATRPRVTTWLMIYDAKDKRPSRNVLVRNNIATVLSVEGENVTFDHNLAQLTITYRSNGREAHIKDGAIDDNKVNHGIFGTFANFNLRNNNLDFRPGPRSPAAGAGLADRAPQVDIEGRPRVPPIDIGAYAR